MVIGLVAFLISGFVAPGFLKSDSGDHEEKSAASDAVKKNIAGKFMSAINGGKNDNVVRLFCDRSKSADAQLLTKMNAKVGQKDSVSPNTLAFSITVHGVQEPIPSAHLKPRGSDWCIDEFGFLTPDAPVSKIKSDLRQIRGFLKKGRVGPISRRMCPEVPRVSSKLEALLKKNKGQIDVDDPLDEGGKIYQGEARLMLSDFEGESVASGSLTLRSIDAGQTWCVSEFEMEYR